MLNKLVTIILGFFLMASLVSAHTIESGPQNASVEGYDIEFSIEPKFPLVGKNTYLNFIITDNDGTLLKDLKVNIELHKDEIINLDLNEKQKGHYNVTSKFKQAGDYEIHLIIENKELEIEFNLEIDNFGKSGFLRLGTIVLLLLILIGLAYRDCRNRKTS